MASPGPQSSRSTVDAPPGPTSPNAHADLELVKQIATHLKLPIDEHGPDTIGYDDVLDTIESRVKRRME